MRCQERSGVLFNHDCDQPATQTCSLCQKPTCDRHLREFQDKPACTSCVRKGLQAHRERGQQLSGSYADDPYFYFFYSGSSWTRDPYDADDYDLFDAAPEEGDWSESGDWAGS